MKIEALSLEVLVADRAVHSTAERRAKLRIFISYRRGHNQAEAHLLRSRLLEAGFAAGNVFIDLEQRYGVSYVDQIEQAVNSCDVLIAVIAPGWVETAHGESGRLHDESNWNRREIEAAMHRKVTVIPVLAPGAAMPEPDRVPRSLLKFRELHALPVSPEPDGYNRLVTRLDAAAQEIAALKISNARPPNSAFVGREALLQELAAKLAQPHDRTSLVAVVGLPAHGKTQLALEYAHRHRDDYRIVWEVPAEQRTSCRERFGALSPELKLPERPWGGTCCSRPHGPGRSRGMVVDSRQRPR
jgi:hypothetical protein